jgi:hypothetical protein
MAMRRLISLVAVLLLLASAAPVMACVTNLAMSHAESACCRSMHGQCGEMAKQGCCQTVVHNDSPQFATESATLAVHWTVVTRVESLISPVTLDNPARQMFLAEHSPPGLLIAQTTVLRI